MNNLREDIVERRIWEEIAGDLAGGRKAERCFCYGAAFCRYLSRNTDPAFSPESFSGHIDQGSTGETCDLLVGWQVLEEDRLFLTPETIYNALVEGGEAFLYGYYRNPRPEDIREWERRCTGDGEGEAIRFPPPAAVSLGRISGWLKVSPFNRYTIRKKGVYYQAWLKRED